MSDWLHGRAIDDPLTAEANMVWRRALVRPHPAGAATHRHSAQELKAITQDLFDAAKSLHVAMPINRCLAPSEFAQIPMGPGVKILFVGPQYAANVPKLTAEGGQRATRDAERQIPPPAFVRGGAPRAWGRIE